MFYAFNFLPFEPASDTKSLLIEIKHFKTIRYIIVLPEEQLVHLDIADS